MLCNVIVILLDLFLSFLKLVILNRIFLQNFCVAASCRYCPDARSLRSDNLRKELGMPEVYLNEKFVNKELVL